MLMGLIKKHLKVYDTDCEICNFYTASTKDGVMAANSVFILVNKIFDSCCGNNRNEIMT